MTATLDVTDVGERYRRDGVVSPIPVITPEEAAAHRARLEAAEAELGPLHYIDKVHTVLTSPFELATHPTVLDCVEEFIGPNILLYNSTFIIKEPGSEAKVSWHQDLTYWGFEDDDAQVAMWFALAPATERSGCMQMIPGSHHRGRLEHVNVAGDNNILLLGQRIEDLETSGAVYHPLAPGEASFHHGWTLHASSPNRSADRRIGLNATYVAPTNRHAAGHDASAVLVRGVDVHRHFGRDEPARTDLDPVAVERWRNLDEQSKRNFRTIS